MADSLQNIKRRAKSVKNIGQITKAMELVAATKMRRSQEIALASRPYAFAVLDFLANLSRLRQDYGGQARRGDATIPSLLQKRKIEKTALVLVTSDKGLAGSFNSAVIREFEKFVKHNANDANYTRMPRIDDEKFSYIAVGQKAANYLQKKSLPIIQKFLRVGDYTTVEEVKPISEFLISGYLKKEWDNVIVFSTHFRSALRQEPLQRTILPVDLENLKKTAQEIIPESGRFAEFKESWVAGQESRADYLIEPSPEIVLNELVPHLVTMQIYHLVLEANASEHAARRLAMKNASDNAEELGSELNLEYNKSRQASITREIIEITSGAEAMK